MTALPVDPGQGWTFADLGAMPEDDMHRYELVSPAPGGLTALAV